MKKFLALLAVVAMASTTNISFGQATQSATAQTQHMTKAGTADKRYKENKTQASTVHTTKSGKPDMRYKENKKPKS